MSSPSPRVLPKVAAVIPARLSSRRFPRKILARDTGKYLVQHVYERVVGCPGLDRVLIAADSREVVEACRSFGAEVVLTSEAHVSGTDRVAEVARGLSHEIVINVQGDEPLIEHGDLRILVDLFQTGGPSFGDGAFEEGSSGSSSTRQAASAVMTTLAARRTDLEGFLDPNVVKVVIARDGHALYFSRASVPYDDRAHRASGSTTRGSRDTAGGPEWYQHVGIYAYRRDFLLQLASLPPTPLEQRERLEQLRVLEHGYRIRVGITFSRHLGIDTEAEYRSFVAEYLQTQRHQR